jgi:hypothetical protein
MNVALRQSVLSVGVLLACAVTSSVAAQAPVGVAPAILSSTPCLKFRLTRENILPAKLLNSKIERQVKEVSRQWKQAGRSDANIAEGVSQLKADLQRRKQVYEITLQYDDERFYYEEHIIHNVDLDIPFDKIIVYYNGKYTYKLLGHGLYIYDHKDFSGVNFLPNFGRVAFGAAPYKPPADPKVLEQYNLPDSRHNADVYRSDIASNEIGGYGPGYAALNSDSTPKTLYYLSPGNPAAITDYENYQTKNLGLASRSIDTSFYFPDGDKLPTKTSERRDTQELISAKSEAVAFRAPDMLKLLRRDDPIVIENHSQVSKFQVDFEKYPELREYFVAEGPSLALRIGLGVAVSITVLVSFDLIRRLAGRRVST